jgi:hypothetical protein
VRMSHLLDAVFNFFKKLFLLFPYEHESLSTSDLRNNEILYIKAAA